MNVPLKTRVWKVFQRTFEISYFIEQKGLALQLEKQDVLHAGRKNLNISNRTLFK